jgi:hypothetical protein
MFATLLSVPRINADDVTPSHGLFLTCRGEKSIQYYTIIYMDSIYVWGLLMQQIPYLIW